MKRIKRVDKYHNLLILISDHCMCMCSMCFSIQELARFHCDMRMCSMGDDWIQVSNAFSVESKCVQYALWCKYQHAFNVCPNMFNAQFEIINMFSKCYRNIFDACLDTSICILQMYTTRESPVHVSIHVLKYFKYGTRICSIHNFLQVCGQCMPWQKHQHVFNMVVSEYVERGIWCKNPNFFNVV